MNETGGLRSAGPTRAQRLPAPASFATPLPFAPMPIVVALVVGALGLSLLLFPSVRERALMHVEAGRPERANELLERNLRDGDRSPVNVRTLARLRAGRGDINGAIELLTDPANVRPDDVAALRALAAYYRLGHRRAGQLATLERLQQLAPDTDQLRELAALYGELGMSGSQRKVLQQLVMHGDVVVEPAEYLALARLQLSDDPRGAADTLARLRANHPAAVDASIVTAQMSALRSAGAIDEAVKVGHGWVAGMPGRLHGVAALFAGALIPGGHYGVAATFLEPYAAPDNADPGVIAVWAQAQIDAGDSAGPLLRMQRARQRGVGDAALQTLHVRLALSVRAFEDGWATARELGLARLPAADVVALCAAALEEQRFDVLRTVLADIGDKALAADPLVAAKVQLALGDLVAARRWSLLAAPQAEGDPVRRIQLARVEQRLAEPARALVSVRAVAATPRLQAALLPEIARLYIALGAPHEGFEVMSRRRRNEPSASADNAWALTAAATGHPSELVRWLDNKERPAAPADFYLDLTHLAMDAKAYALAVACARQLLSARATDPDRFLMARALLAADRPAQALPYLRTLPRKSAQEQAVYARALLAAWRLGEPVQTELRTHWTARLSQATAPIDRDEALAVLLELRAYDTALPVMATLAIEEPQRWLAAFTDAAGRSARRALLHSVWARLGNSAETAPAIREDVAFRLLHAGDKRAAERIWRDLAEHAPHDDPAVQRLLHLWGPRPTSEQIDWLATRARRAPAGEIGKWLRDLVRVGAPARAVAVHDLATPDAQADATMDEAYIDALLALRDKPAIARALRHAVAANDSAPAAPGATLDATQWRRWVDLAVFVDDAGLQRQALRRLVSTAAADASAQRTLAVLAYQAGDRDEAEKSLAAFEDITGGDLDSHMLFADIRRDRGDAGGARRHWARALEWLDARRDLTFAQRAAKARLLHRLGRATEAAAMYEALVAERGDDANLRADYATLLLALGRLDQAQVVLERP